MNLGRYKDPDRKEKGITLKEARQKYLDAAKKVPDGIDPLLEKDLARLQHKQTPTVAKFIDTYIEKHAMVKKRSWRSDKQALEMDILPAWAK